MSDDIDKKLDGSVHTADVEKGTVEDTQKYRTWLRYNSPIVQVMITAFVAFGCPGMYNSLTGIGAGGQVDTNTTSTGNIALYAINAGVYLFIAPIVYHYTGSRWCMFFGGMAYPLYAGSLLAYNHIASRGFVIAAAAILGIGSSHLWVGQGALMTGAPLPHEKGLLIGLYWFVFNIGGVIGSFIEMGINFDSVQSTVSDPTYAVFIALMGAGFLAALLILPQRKIVRTDGSRIRPVEERPNVVRDFIKILKILPRKETIVLLPFFIASNWCYTYQQNTVNLRLFNIRTRGFDSAFYWFGAFTSPIMGIALDNKRWSRRKTAISGYLLLVVLHFIVFGGGVALQLRSASSADDTSDNHMYKTHALDFLDSGTKFAGPFLLYFAYGIFDSLWQTYAYWIIGCIGTDDEVSARYVGLYKSMQSAGAAVAWKLNAMPISYTLEFGLNWGIMGGSLIVLAPFFLWMKEPEEQVPEQGGFLEGAEIMPSIYAVRSDQTHLAPSRSKMSPQQTQVAPSRTIDAVFEGSHS